MIRTVLFWFTAIFSFLILFPIPLVLRSRKKQVHAIQKFWSRILLKTAGVKVRIEGLERVEPYGSYMIMANHQSYFDIFILLSLPLFIHWMAKKELFAIPLFGWMLKTAFGGISIDRESRAKGSASIKKAARMVRNGATVLIFPEGTRGTDGKLLPFNEGGFFLAILSRAVILP